MYRKLLIFTFSVLITISVFSINAISADALSGSQFKAGRIIDDAVFFNGNAMSAAQIQNFLNSKVPSCDTNGTQMIRDDDNNDTVSRKTYANRRGVSTPFTCLKSYRMNTPLKSGQAGLCSTITAKSNRTAAHIIDDVSRACGISQKVMLVLLQKENSFITDDWPWPGQYKTATGFGCPDSGPNYAANCNSAYFGFFNQVYLAAKQYKIYIADPTEFSHRSRATNRIGFHPNPSCGFSNVYIENQATTGLYNYTPYRPNSAALNNLYGTGNGCSAYGNRNFWRLFNDWFGSTEGTPFFRINNGDAVFTLSANGNYYHINTPEKLRAYGYGVKVNKIANFGSSYISGKTNLGHIPLIARFEGDEIYLIDNGRASHFQTRDMLQDYGYDIGEEALLSSTTVGYLKSQGAVRNVSRHLTSPAIFLIEDGKKKHFVDRTAFDSGSPAYSSLPDVTLSANFLTTVSDGAPIIVGEKIIKKTDGSYGHWDGTGLQAINTQAAKDLKLVPDYGGATAAVNQLPASVRPTIDRKVRNSGGSRYLLNFIYRLGLSSTNLEDTGLEDAEFTLVSNDFLAKIPSKSFRNIYRINGSDAIYTTIDGSKVAFTSQEALSEYGYTIQQAYNLSSQVSNLFSSSAAKIYKSGTVFRVDGGQEVYMVNTIFQYIHFPSRAMLEAYGYRLDRVGNVSSSNISLYSNSGNVGYFIKRDGDGIYLLRPGTKKSGIPSEILGSEGYDITPSSIPLFTGNARNRIGNLTAATNLIQASGDSKVYLVTNGQKRWITSREALSQAGYGFDDITTVNAGMPQTLTSGSNIN